MGPELIAKIGDTDESKKLFTVLRETSGVIWCNCPEWPYSPSSPRVCKHIAQLADDAVLPAIYREVYLESLPVTETQLVAPVEPVLASETVVAPEPPVVAVEPVTPVQQRLTQAFAALRKTKLIALQNAKGTVPEAMRELATWMSDHARAGKKYRGFIFTPRSESKKVASGASFHAHYFPANIAVINPDDLIEAFSRSGLQARLIEVGCLEISARSF